MYRILSAHGLFSLARAFIGAVLVVYLTGKGIDLATIAIAKAAQLVISVLFNYPAGLISDKFGNKVTILLACVAELIYFILMMYPSNTTVIIGEMFNGLGLAFYIGAYESWIFTHKKTAEDSFSLISRSSEMLFIATIISGVLGAIFSRYSLLLSACFMIVAFSLYLFTPEKRKKTMDDLSVTRRHSGIVKLFKTADSCVVNYIVIGGFMQLIYQFWPVFFKNSPLLFSQQQIGFVFGGSMIAQWLFTSYARKKNFNKKKYAPLFCYIGILLTSLATIIMPSLFAGYAIIIAFLYCLFISCCTLTVNYFFSRSCNLYSNSMDESSMISLLDTGARCLGACFLTIVSIINIQDVVIIWSIFPAFVAVILVTGLFKKVLSYER